MAISPIGNITYINQNTQATAATIRHDITPGVSQEFEDKLKNIEETRPTEDANKIDKDTQRQNQQSFQEQGKGEKNPSEEETQTSSHTSHLLDVKA
ncbi:hypothetical protein [Helicobacter mustelae]|uniref:Putative periplasmic protein n=1 Tax=Helicobacter mustelae (strain ATCC 43772 / CCUG 25715 / CIP 103759 / LMG 18044 / NCTC 12198 / R85-136P) TaxID=679897 RepID=D3UIU4_HELM1|nr:hypothetical protein [Helicobacter mustelae]CBG40419.1 putative periplasmic protein [Helicobacter mustelae 12198]SQH71919.1 Uncharacterised protein [Helicobacter mustelae]STP13059.1 Uncharacterised protein [Helicobacter mustelae]